MPWNSNHPNKKSTIEYILRNCIFSCAVVCFASAMTNIERCCILASVVIIYKTKWLSGHFFRDSPFLPLCKHNDAAPCSSTHRFFLFQCVAAKCRRTNTNRIIIRWLLCKLKLNRWNSILNRAEADCYCSFFKVSLCSMAQYDLLNSLPFFFHLISFIHTLICYT